MTTMLGLDLNGRRVLVVGGGPVSARRAAGFVAAGSDVLVVAPHPCEAMREMVSAGAVQWRDREVESQDIQGAWLVHTATGDVAIDGVVANWAESARVWCIRASDATAGSARVPATTEVAGLLIGVLSAGDPDPARAAAVRDQIHRHLASGSVDLRARRIDGRPGRVTLVGGGPGPDDLITVRGLLALGSADVVVTDRLAPLGLLGGLAPGAEIVDVGKLPGNHPVPQREINRLLITNARRGLHVVRLKGGDSFVLGRGGEEMLACQEAGVAVEVVPGVTSAIAVPAAAGIPVTHRGVATAFHVITGHDGLTPAVAEALRAGTVTVVVLMGVAKLRELADSAVAAGVRPDTPLAIIERGFMPQQRVIRSTLAAGADAASHHGVQAPAVIVLGNVAAMDVLAGPQVAS